MKDLSLLKMKIAILAFAILAFVCLSQAGEFNGTIYRLSSTQPPSANSMRKYSRPMSGCPTPPCRKSMQRAVMTKSAPITPSQI